MKKFLFLLLTALCTPQLWGQTIDFSILPLAKGSELSPASQELLQKRMEQIITRNSAGAASEYNVFVIQPGMSIVDKKSTSGLTRNVTLVKGELTLIAKNKVDGSLYHSTVVAVSGDATEGDDPYKAMIKAIRVTDPVYTRFIRIARQKIEDYYAKNCAIILLKAKGLYDAKKYQEAVSYLSAVSASLPCYEQASVLQAELAQYMPDAPDTVIVQKVIEKVVEKVVEKPVIVEKIVEKVVEKPVIIEKIVERPVAQETPKVNADITFSTNRLQLKVLKCTGNAAQRRITILTEMTNVDTNRNIEEIVNMISAFTDNGSECKNFELQNNSQWVKMPPRVTIRREFYVTKVFDKFSSFSYIELNVGGTRVYIRNLPIQW